MPLKAAAPGVAQQGTSKPSKPPARPVAAPLHTSRIIKAGALLADTKTLLAHWDAGQSVSSNLDQIRRQNPFGKASRSRVEDILGIFHHRYLTEPSVTAALVTLVRSRFPTTALERILYFHSARADSLLHDAVTEILVPQHNSGLVDLSAADFQSAIALWVAQGKMTGQWSDTTTARVAQGLLATLRDFGVLQGTYNKKIAPAFLPPHAFAYIAFYLKQHQPSGGKLLEHPDWKLFFLSREAVERFLFEAHQLGLLEYHVAGSVVRLTFPAQSLEEYAHALAQR
jgi:hypothetical protein